MLRGKTGKTFLVQFARPNGAIIFCRTFKNYFGQFVWIENKPRTAKVGAISKAQKVQNFQNMLMTFFYENLTKKFHPKEAFRAGKTLQKFGHSGWDKCEHFFSNLRLLLSETEYTSEITSQIRI